MYGLRGIGYHLRLTAYRSAGESLQPFVAVTVTDPYSHVRASVMGNLVLPPSAQAEKAHASMMRREPRCAVCHRLLTKLDCQRGAYRDLAVGTVTIVRGDTLTYVLSPSMYEASIYSFSVIGAFADEDDAYTLIQHLSEGK